MNKIKVSFIVPYYKTLELTKQLLDVLIPQVNRDDVELIIVDDGCYEQELNNHIVLKDIIKSHIIMNKKENGGVSSARNIGLDIRVGEYTAFIDSDDLVTEDYVEQILEAIKSEKEIYLTGWESFGATCAVYEADNLPYWNVAVWPRIFRSDLITHKFNENMKACEDKQFMLDNGFMFYADPNFIPDANNIENNMKQPVIPSDMIDYGYIDKPIYKYNSGRADSLSNLYL